MFMFSMRVQSAFASVKVLPIVLIELVGEVCVALQKPMGVCCNSQMQQSRMGGFRALPCFCCFSLCLPLSSCYLGTNGTHCFTATTGTNRRKSLEGRESET